MRRVVFCHGKESGPRGFKIRELSAIAERCGWHVTSVDFTGEEGPDRRVAHLLEQMDAEQPDEMVLVGSSMGGYVAAVASATLRPSALFLMAPAIGLPGYRVRHPDLQAGRSVIVHGRFDEVVPAENVIGFASARRAELHVLNAGHDLHDAIADVKFLFQGLLDDMNR